MPIGNPQIELMKCESPVAAVLSNDPILCTRCAALAGCWMTHHRRKATPPQVRTVLSFNAASLEAQSSPLCQLFLYLSPEPAWVEVQAGGLRRSDGWSMPETSRRYACVPVRVCRPRRKHAAPHAPAEEVRSRGRWTGSCTPPSRPVTAVVSPSCGKPPGLLGAHPRDLPP